MVKGIGCDIVRIKRFEDKDDAFLQKFLTNQEINETKKFTRAKPYESFLARRWAAKEAISKALCTGFSCGISPTQIQIEHGDNGIPKVKLLGKAEESAEVKGITEILITISDEDDYAIAYAIVQ